METGLKDTTSASSNMLVEEGIRSLAEWIIGREDVIDDIDVGEMYQSDCHTR